MSRLKLTVLGFLGFIVMLSVFRVSVAQATDNDQFRWDIVHVTFPPNFEASEGGQATALANDCVSTGCSKITVIGHGTFRVGDPKDVTGGGTWQTFDNTGLSTGSGTFEVTRLVRFDVAPGTKPARWMMTSVTER